MNVAERVKWLGSLSKYKPGFMRSRDVDYSK